MYLSSLLFLWMVPQTLYDINSCDPHRQAAGTGGSHEYRLIGREGLSAGGLKSSYRYPLFPADCAILTLTEREREKKKERERERE